MKLFVICHTLPINIIIDIKTVKILNQKPNEIAINIK